MKLIILWVATGLMGPIQTASNFKTLFGAVPRYSKQHLAKL